MLIALTFAFTFINIKLPITGSGGLIHLGNIPLVVAAIVFSRRHAAVAGAFGMSLFDVAGGWLAWAPFTFVIRAAMGFLIGLIAQARGGKNIALNVAAVLAGGAVMLVGYYFTEVILYGNFVTPFLSVPGNALQVASAVLIGIPVAAALKKIRLPGTARD
jgi:uncharacterized membrane protein